MSSEALTHISVPFPARQLKRGDYICLVVEFVGTEDVRVTGVKEFPADVKYPHRHVYPRVRINVEHADGRKTSQWLSGHTEGCFLAYKVIPNPSFTKGSTPVLHDEVPNGSFVEDEVGDIAYRWGDEGIWVRINGQQRKRPCRFRWESEKHHQWKLAGIA